jgi:hypothetical protein
MVDPLFEALLAEDPVPNLSSAPTPDQPLRRFVPVVFYMCGMERQRFWLN